MPEKAARRLAADPPVAYVQRNGTCRIDPGLLARNRIRRRGGSTGSTSGMLPLDASYTYPNTASNVRAYILSTGIRTTHVDFGGRAIHGRDTVDNDNDATDCNGHGTAVAGIVGGTAHGVAKNVTLVAVRMLNCAGSGDHRPGHRGRRLGDRQRGQARRRRARRGRADRPGLQRGHSQLDRLRRHLHGDRRFERERRLPVLAGWRHRGDHRGRHRHERQQALARRTSARAWTSSRPGVRVTTTWYTSDTATINLRARRSPRPTPVAWRR